MPPDHTYKILVAKCKYINFPEVATPPSRIIGTPSYQNSGLYSELGIKLLGIAKLGALKLGIENLGIVFTNCAYTGFLIVIF